LSVSAQGFLPFDSAYALARAYAAKAVALDSMSSEAWVAQGRVLQVVEWNVPGAEKAFKRAVELDPNNVFAYGYRGIFLAGVKRQHELGIQDGQTALKLDSLNSLVHHQYGQILNFSGNWDEAIKHHRRALALAESPFATPHTMIGGAYLSKGDEERLNGDSSRARAAYDSAAAEWAEARKLKGAFRQGDESAAIAYVHALYGQRTEAVEMLARLQNSRNKYRWMQMARLHLALGHRDSAFAMIDSAVAKKAWTTYGPSLLGARVFAREFGSEPRWTRLLQKAGLLKE
jgi:tetratricopeptide (TPR) repeat protein